MTEILLDYPHDECPECGSSVQIRTSCPQELAPEDVREGAQPLWVYDGDAWICEDGHAGHVDCDSENLVSLGDAEE